MGVDKSDIRTVIHRDTPPSVEAFLQESGRGGRDRRPARSYLIVSREDRDAAQRLPDATARVRYEALLSFAGDSSRCRRENLLKLLDAAPEFCFGCDVCDGSVVARPEALDAIVELVRHRPRRYTTRELQLLLTGRKTLDARLRGLDLSPQFGTLSSWEPDDIETAIGELARSRVLRLPRHGPWKHRVKLGSRHHRRELPSSAPT
ncbi:MAG TPA: hypothetical protein VMW69_11240 [Spirochaetia bacterium]|nr:hypothetical protein [Spirochaetia bacterium]